MARFMKHASYYRITGKFGDGFNLANWRVCSNSPNLKSPIIALLHYAYAVG